MRGSIFKRCIACNARMDGRSCGECGGEFTWAFIVDIGRGADGRRRQRRRQGYDTKAEAEQALRTLLHKVDRQQYVPRDDVTVADFLRDEWLPANRPPNLRESTWTSYAGELERHVIPTLGGIPLQKLNPVHLNKLYGDLLEDGRMDGTGGLSPRTVRYIHTIVRKALSDGMRWGRLERNVADLADPPRSSGTRPGGHIQTWSAEQLRTFLEHVAVDRLYPAWLLAANTGMRRGEVLGLRWRDVDLDAARLAVRQTYVSVDGRARFSEPKTPRSRRTIDLDEHTVAALRAWRETQAAERQAWGQAHREHGLVFTREDGAPVEPDGFSKAFTGHAEDAGLPRIRLHDLRHTHATLLLAAGTNVKVVSERLGHHSTAFTMDTYAHAIPGMQADAAERVAGLVLGDPQPDPTGDDGDPEGGEPPENGADDADSQDPEHDTDEREE